jgi:hypothetical protein
MALPERPLDGLQRWMQRVVLDMEPAKNVEREILPSRTLTAGERLEIYHRMYPMRMREALESDYPALVHFLGDDAFEDLVRRYVAAHPSRSYTLNRLGDHLAEFIAADKLVRRPAFCAELARLEHAIAVVFDGPETPLLDAAAVAEMGERIAEIPLRPVDAFRLLSFRYPVGAYLDSVRDENHAHPRLTLKNTWIAVFRHDYAVRRLDLLKEQYTLLQALEAGSTVGDAVMKILRTTGHKLSPDEFFVWFRRWVSAGVFRELEERPGSDTLGSGL